MLVVDVRPKLKPSLSLKRLQNSQRDVFGKAKRESDREFLIFVCGFLDLFCTFSPRCRSLDLFCRGADLWIFSTEVWIFSQRCGNS